VETDDDFELGALRSMYELEAALRRFPGLHIRYSEGPAADSDGVSTDAESGLELPGLSANPLEPEDWWHRPVGDWLARQLCQYKHLCDRNPDRYAWVLTGRMAGRGPDCEPLLANVSPVARLAPELLVEAEERYIARFDAGQGPEG
jgi:hypothetical protein